MKFTEFKKFCLIDYTDVNPLIGLEHKMEEKNQKIQYLKEFFQGKNKSKEERSYEDYRSQNFQVSTYIR